MLAPPPEGTFDIDPQSIPIKCTTKSDGSPEQDPLLTQEEGGYLTGPNASRKWKVRLT